MKMIPPENTFLSATIAKQDLPIYSFPSPKSPCKTMSLYSLQRALTTACLSLCRYFTTFLSNDCRFFTKLCSERQIGGPRFGLSLVLIEQQTCYLPFASRLSWFSVRRSLNISSFWTSCSLPVPMTSLARSTAT